MTATVLYFEGSTAGASATFTDQAGELADPTTVTAEIRQPDGTIVTFVPTSNTVGVWTIEFVVDQPGRYYTRFEGTGVVAAVVEGFIDVALSRVEPPDAGIVTVQELADIMVTTFTPQQVTAASMVLGGQIADVEQFLGRPLETETITGERVTLPNSWDWSGTGPQTLSLRRDPVLSIQRITFGDGSVLDPTYYVMRPWGFDLWGLWAPIYPFWAIDNSIYIDYTAGLLEAHPEALTAIRTAVLRAAQRELTLQLSGMRGLRSLSVDGGTSYVRDIAPRLEDPGAGLNDGEKALISRFRRKTLG